MTESFKAGQGALRSAIQSRGRGETAEEVRVGQALVLRRLPRAWPVDAVYPLWGKLSWLTARTALL